MDSSASDLGAELATELDRLAAGVTALAEVNSGSFNVEGVDRCGSRLAAMLDELRPDRVEQLPVGPTPVMSDIGTVELRPVGRAVVAAKRPDAPFQVLLFGHLDTVYPADSPFQRVRREGHTLHGPGVADCKGGLVVAVEALRFLERSAWGGDTGWRFVAVPDEEVGSVGSKALLADRAAGCLLGLGFEPALPGGGVAAGRKGSLTVHLVVHGRSAHVGRAHGQGRSAIRALARLVDRLEAENDTQGVTVNCGRIRGGGALNAVPDLAIGSFNVRVESAADQRRIERVLADVVGAASTDGVEVAVHWTSARPPKEHGAALDALLADVVEAGADLGQTLTGEDTGGSCDGNDLAAAGLVNVDSLGIGGGAIHSPDEFALLDTVPGRSALVVELLWRRLAAAGGVR